jgi:hypothetical protein
VYKLFSFLLLVYIIYSCGNSRPQVQVINPNQFRGTDTQRIQTAINAAEGTTNKVLIPSVNANGTNTWLLDSAILIPGNMTIILENCTLQLSDKSRDNMFRSNNTGTGIADPVWISNISIVGVGDVLLKGAENPRSTGDGGRTLIRDPSEAEHWRVSYGSDAGKDGMKQTGDWRNIMILMAYVDGYKLKNLNIENAHAWAISNERVVNAEISDIRFNCPEDMVVNGRDVKVSNRDGINLRHGCKNFRINNISGNTGDDFIALSILGLNSEIQEGGTLNSTMVTGRKFRGREDDIENINITNLSCEYPTWRGVAIRANDVARIQNVYINGMIWNGPHNPVLLGGSGYGNPNLPGNINNIHIMNVIGYGKSLIHIGEAVANCYFANCIYLGDGDEIITYNIDKNKTKNIVAENMIKRPSE